MPKKKPKMGTCPQCGCSLKPENLERHLRKVHGLDKEGYGKDKKMKLSKAEERLMLKEKQKNKLKMIFGIVAGVILTLVIGWFLFQNLEGDRDTPASSVNDDVVNEDTNYVSIPITLLGDGKLHKYSYTATNGRNVNYFLVLGPDTKYHSAINLCQKLHSGNTGWYQDGDYIICETEDCGYPINAIGTGTPGCCSPIELEFQEVNSHIRIEKQDLEFASQYFT